MTTDNPFATPLAELAPPADSALPGNRQPLQFVGAMMLASALLLLGTVGSQWLMDLGGFRDRLEQFLPMMLANWAGGLILHAAAVLLLAHHLRERYDVARFQPIGALLAGFVVLYLVFTVIASTALSYLSLPFHEWAFANARVSWVLLYGQFESLLNLALGCLLPLWLVLRLSRGRSRRLAGELNLGLPAWQIALGLALVVVALLYRLFAALSYTTLPLGFGAGWQSMLLLSGCVLPFGIVMAAVISRLPARLPRFSAGRVLGAALMLLVIWGAAGLLLSVVVAIAAYAAASTRNLPFYLLPPALLLLACLWPFARWCAGRFFAEQLAQSSPR